MVLGPSWLPCTLQVLELRRMVFPLMPLPVRGFFTQPWSPFEVLHCVLSDKNPLFSFQLSGAYDHRCLWVNRHRALWRERHPNRPGLQGPGGITTDEQMSRSFSFYW